MLVSGTINIFGVLSKETHSHFEIEYPSDHMLQNIMEPLSDVVSSAFF